MNSYVLTSGLLEQATKTACGWALWSSCTGLHKIWHSTTGGLGYWSNSFHQHIERYAQQHQAGRGIPCKYQSFAEFVTL